LKIESGNADGESSQKQKRRPELGGVWIRSAEVVEREPIPEFSKIQFL
jgi:hypothetical protein